MPQYPSEPLNRNGPGNNQLWCRNNSPLGNTIPPRSTLPGPAENLNSPKKSIPITGKTNHPVITIGTFNLSILNTLVEFHPVENSITISPDGIRGRFYLKQEQAQISLQHNTLVTISNPIKPIRTRTVTPLKSSTGLYYEYLGTMRWTSSTWRITIFMDISEIQSLLSSFKHNMENLAAHCQPGYEEHCHRVTANYSLGSKLNLAERLQEELMR